MTEDQLVSKVEAMLQMSSEEAKKLLPLLLEEIFGYGMERMPEQAPVLSSMLIETLIQIDAADFMTEVPEASAKFMNILWSALGILAGKSGKMKVILEKMGDVKVNLEASDSPMSGYFVISQGRIAGGTGLLPYKDQDFRFFGPTRVLLQLLNGDLALGFNNPRLQTEGHPGFLPILAPVMEGISTLIKVT